MRMQSPGCRRSSPVLYTLISFTFLMLLKLANFDFTSHNPRWFGQWSGPMVNAQVQNGSGITTIDVQLPSESTGVSGGTLALRIFSPSGSSMMRHAEGAPVLILAPGGETPGTLEAPIPRATSVVRIAFLYPGGRDGGTQRSSSGSYDYRGERSIAAMRDVILYAAGQLPDSQGRLINGVVPVPVQTDNIGLFGSSNGGNMVVAVLARHGHSLARYVRYIIQWESPVLSQVATVEAGPARLQCSGNRRESLASGNPWYRPEGNSLTELAIDYSRLRYHQANPAVPVFIDGNGDGRYTTIPDPARPGCQTPDLNGDGQLTTIEDRPLAAYGGATGKQYYSRQATAALTISSWPATIATPEEARSFWDLREAVHLYDDAVAQAPELEAMLLTGFTDHVQTTMTENAHVRMAFENLRKLGRWVRVNPGRQAVISLDPKLASRRDLPDNPASTPPVDWTARATYTYPDNLESAYWAAAVYEMADRARLAPRAARSESTAPVATAATSTPPALDIVAAEAPSHGIDPDWLAAPRVMATSSSSNLQGTVANNMVVRKDGTVIVFYRQGATNTWTQTANNGLTWSSPGTLYPAAALAQSTISADIDQSDNIYIVWKASQFSLGLAKYDGARWTATTINTLTRTESDRIGFVQVTVDRQGRLHLMWQQGDHQSYSAGVRSSCWYARSTDGGLTFKVTQLSQGNLSHAAFPVADFGGTAGNNLLIAWRENVNGCPSTSPSSCSPNGWNWDVKGRVSRDGGATWGKVVTLRGSGRNDADDDQWDPSVVVDRQGVFHLFYHVYHNNVFPDLDANVFYQYSLDGGTTWSGPSQLSTANVRSHLIKTAYDYANNLVWCVWKDEVDFGKIQGSTQADLQAVSIRNTGTPVIGATEFATDHLSSEVAFHNFKVGGNGLLHATYNLAVEGGASDKIYYTQRQAPATIASLVANPSALSFSATAGSATLRVESSGPWTIQESLEWLSLSKLSGNGHENLTITVTANQALEDRRGTLTITSGSLTRQVSVTQQRLTPTLTVGTTALSLPAAGSSQAVSVSSNTTWSVTDNSDYVSVSPLTGSGNGSITITCQPNIQTQSRTASIILTANGGAAVTISLTQAGLTPNSPTSSDYGIFSINVQDFSYPEKSIATVNRILDIHEKHGIPVDIYLTTTMIDLFEQLSPALVERLRTSPVVAVSYHVRPPKPYYTNFDWAGLGSKSAAEQFSIIRNYETHGLDLTTGLPTTASGGYQKLKDLLGYAPWAASAQADGGLAQQAALVFKELGGRFRVIHGRPSNLGDQQDGTYVRPEHYDLLLFQTVGQDARTVVENGISQARQATGAKAPYFVGIKMHDNDFFAVDSAWVTVYARSSRRPPFNISKKSELLSDPEQLAIWQHYEATVAYVASQKSRFTAVGLPTVWKMLNPSTEPTPVPVETALTRVFISGTMHIESNRLRWPKVDALLAFFERATRVGRVGAQASGMRWSVGADIGWLTGEPRAAEVIAKLEALGVEMDIHAHNFADRANCAAQITKLGGHPNRVSSGNIVTEIDALRSPVRGSNGATWQAEILYGTAQQPGHAEGSEDLSYGIWRPKSGREYTVHDPAGNLISVGGGPRTLAGATTIIQFLRQRLQSKQVMAPVYSTTVMVHPDSLVVVGTTEGIEQLEAWANSAGLEAHVSWATLTESAAAWVKAGSQASRLDGQTLATAR